MKYPFTIVVSILFGWLIVACNPASIHSQSNIEKQINTLLDSLNLAAANADYNTYFGYFADHAVFMGTDATERWTKQEFMQWALPFFERGKAWRFKSIDRHVYINNEGKVAWFDELLDTQMKICRGSGVLTNEHGRWKLQQYVLSITVPNQITDTVVRMKQSIEEVLIQQLDTTK